MPTYLSGTARKLASPLRTWDQEAMSAAYKDVMDDGERVSTAALRFGVPRKSLDDRVKGNVDLDCKMGKQPSQGMKNIAFSII